VYSARRFHLRVRGDFACFTDSALRAERYSYDIPTPTALRGMCEQIHWREGLRWETEKIELLAPIQRYTFFANELKAFSNKPFDASDRSTIRASTVLIDVDYRVTVYLTLKNAHRYQEGEETAILRKSEDMFERYVNKGKVERDRPYLGLREFVCDVQLATDSDPKPIAWTQRLSRMPYDYLWEGPQSRIRNTVLEYTPYVDKGVVHVPARDTVLNWYRDRGQHVPA